MSKNSNKNINDKPISFKGLIKSILALLLALVITIVGYFIHKTNKKQNNNSYEKPKDSVSETSSNDNELSLEDKVSFDKIGHMVDFFNPEKNDKKEFGEIIEGAFVVDQIVIDDEDTNWIDEEAFENKDKVGNEEFNNQDNTLEKDEDGDIVEKEENFEIKDKNGNEVSTGSNESGKPDDYVYDEELDKEVTKEDVNKFVYVDANYYDKNTGELLYQKGETILKETFEKIKNDSNLTITKPVLETEEVKPEESRPENSNPSDDKVDSYGGIINKDGTYTIYGVLYMDKATFESFILDENSQENFGFYNNIIYPVSVIEEMIQTKSNIK